MASIEADSTISGFVCNLGVMNTDERARYIILSRKLMSAGEERRELDNGYAFKMAAEKISLPEIAEWMVFIISEVFPALVATKETQYFIF